MMVILLIFCKCFIGFCGLTGLTDQKRFPANSVLTKMITWDLDRVGGKKKKKKRMKDAV